MPEGDTLFRTAAVLREVLAGRRVIAARGRPGGAALDRIVGRAVQTVESRGKHLLIDFEGGLTLHTHLQMRGSWHRYRAGERWLRPPSRAVAVVEVEGAVAVCFDAPTVELVETRAMVVHPVVGSLGPDLLAPKPDFDEAIRRLREPERSVRSVGSALLDQGAQAGLGNVYRSEVCFIERVDPFTPVASLDDATLRRLVETGARLLYANRGSPLRTTIHDSARARESVARQLGGDNRYFVYRRTGRPCRRCGTQIRSRTAGDPARRVWWCPTCQRPREPAVPTP